MGAADDAVGLLEPQTEFKIYYELNYWHLQKKYGYI